MSKLIRNVFIAGISSLLCHICVADTIKIGVAGPFSGPYASFGDQLWRGATQAAADINEKGGINGNKIELINADDACEPKQAVAVANRLVNKDNVAAVIGHFCSSSTIPASNVYADAQIVMITPASTNPALTERGFNTIFRTCGRDDQQGIIAAQFISDSLKAKNIAIIHDKDTYGKGLADATKKTLEKLGAKIVLYEGLTRGEKDFNALVSRIKQLNADAVYFGGLHPEAGPLLRQLREQGYQGPFISGDGIASEDFVTSAGGANIVKNVYMTFGSDPRNIPDAQKVVKELESKHIEPEGYTLYSYAALQSIADAIRETHSQDGKKMADWLHQHKVPTVMGEREWDEKGDLKNAPYIIYKWDTDGKYTPVK